MISRIFVSSAAILALSACAAGDMAAGPFAGSGYDKTSEDVQLNTKISFDNYMGQATLTGPELDAGNHKIHIRGWKAPGDAGWRFQVYIVAEFSDWAYLRQAWADGEALDTTEISRDVIHCSAGRPRYGTQGYCIIWETVGINLSPEQVETYAEGMLLFKITGRGGSVTGIVPGRYFDGVLAAIAAGS